MINNKFDKLYNKIITEWYNEEYDMSPDELEDLDYENVSFSCNVINLCKIDFILNSTTSTYDINFAVLDVESNLSEPNIDENFTQDDVADVINSLNDNISSKKIGTITEEQYQQLKSKYNLTELNNFIFFVTDWIDGGKATYKGKTKLDEFNRWDYSDWKTDGNYDIDEVPAQNNIADNEYGLINNNINFDEYSNLLQDILILCNIPSEDKLPGLYLIDNELINDAIESYWENS